MLATGSGGTSSPRHRTQTCRVQHRHERRHGGWTNYRPRAHSLDSALHRRSSQSAWRSTRSHSRESRLLSLLEPHVLLGLPHYCVSLTASPLRFRPNMTASQTPGTIAASRGHIHIRRRGQIVGECGRPITGAFVGAQAATVTDAAVISFQISNAPMRPPPRSSTCAMRATSNPGPDIRAERRLVELPANASDLISNRWKSPRRPEGSQLADALPQGTVHG